MRFSKYLMTVTAALQFVLAVLLMFLPDELIELFDYTNGFILPLTLQIIGACYLGMAMLNWMTKQQLLGGIYGKPVTVLNFTHFSVSAITLIKVLDVSSTLFYPVVILAILYAGLSLGFGYLMLQTPKIVAGSSI